MKLKDAIKLSVERSDLDMLSRCVEQMRYSMGMNYDNVVAFISRVTSLDGDDIEDLFYAIDKAEERGLI